MATAPLLNLNLYDMFFYNSTGVFCVFIKELSKDFSTKLTQTAIIIIYSLQDCGKQPNLTIRARSFDNWYNEDIR